MAGFRLGPVVWLAALLVVAPPVRASLPGAGAAPAAACERAAIAAAAEAGVPADILGALTLTETGRRRGGVTRPWAWSVNAEGSGTWFDDPARALAFAEERVAAGRRNLDIGCFQLNYRWHGQHFASVAEMFDPMANARYAARFVRQLHDETGDWRRAAGAFHSRSPAQAAKYLTRFDSLRANLRQRGWAGLTGAEETFNSFAGDDGRPIGLLADRRSRPTAGGPEAGSAPVNTILAATRVDTGADMPPVHLASAEDGPIPGLGVEVPVPDMSRRGEPIDVALGGGPDLGGLGAPVMAGGADPSAGWPGQGAAGGGGGPPDANGAMAFADSAAGGYAVPLLPGEQRAEAPQPAVEQRRSARPRTTLLGAPMGSERSGMAGSLAILGAARGGLLVRGRTPRQPASGPDSAADPVPQDLADLVPAAGDEPGGPPL